MLDTVEDLIPGSTKFIAVRRYCTN